ncbi:hypothetical protein P153DRAFT_392794 [Dothidotthia symphoricarpi CBS 119687]|uniref:Uncharacterized protein n=1 Tax=Dothidotthia symphoricarpi CBS 119687 TaxID=1392245 RepID=A0A6A6ASN5_9PLEO|nr:uncharacterized protein P153DRAFT_392794 [Dothidotthia symphoricarpi CBS 119687]KAF2134188.1 hypothetical protein P153DRAFT_392794 [Dothidotthia symphoricarpi CBS 119687]
MADDRAAARARCLNRTINSIKTHLNLTGGTYDKPADIKRAILQQLNALSEDVNHPFEWPKNAPFKLTPPKQESAFSVAIDLIADETLSVRSQPRPVAPTPPVNPNTNTNKTPITAPTPRVTFPSSTTPAVPVVASTTQPRKFGHVGPHTRMTPAMKDQLTGNKGCWYCRQVTDPPHMASNCPKKPQSANASTQATTQRAKNSRQITHEEEDEDYGPMPSIEELDAAEQSVLRQEDDVTRISRTIRQRPRVHEDEDEHNSDNEVLPPPPRKKAKNAASSSSTSSSSTSSSSTSSTTTPGLDNIGNANQAMMAGIHNATFQVTENWVHMKYDDITLTYNVFSGCVYLRPFLSVLFGSNDTRNRARSLLNATPHSPSELWRATPNGWISVTFPLLARIVNHNVKAQFPAQVLAAL